MAPAELKHRKHLLRRRLTSRLRAIPVSRLKAKSRKIYAQAAQCDFYREAGKILFYAALAREPETRALMQKALRAGKHVFLPRMNKKNGTVGICRIFNLEKDLVRGAYGILEPCAKLAARKSAASMDVIFVPGLGFTPDGWRLGRGGGHYDRLLAGAPKAIKIGLAFKEQIVKTLPLEKHDQRLDLVLSEE